jgi:hypothetical protein
MVLTCRKPVQANRNGEITVVLTSLAEKFKKEGTSKKRL